MGDALGNVFEEWYKHANEAEEGAAQAIQDVPMDCMRCSSTKNRHGNHAEPDGEGNEAKRRRGRMDEEEERSEEPEERSDAVSEPAPSSSSTPPTPAPCNSPASSSLRWALLKASKPSKTPAWKLSPSNPDSPVSPLSLKELCEEAIEAIELL